MNYLDILRDKEIVALHNQIEKSLINEPMYHGVQHSINTIEYAKSLAKCFNLSDKDTELLLISAVLHNIGHLNGKTLHQNTGAEMAKAYLKKKGLDDQDIKVIYNTINSHLGRRNDDFYNPVSCCLILAEKMDFGASRYKKGVELSDEDAVCSKVSQVLVDNNNGEITLSIGGKGVDWKKFIFTTAYTKLYNCFEWACKKQGYQFKIKKI